MYLLKHILISILLIPLSLFAQDEIKPGEIQWLHVIKKEPYNKIDGSPYHLEWGKGSITLKDGTLYKDLNINHDIYEGQIHVENETQGLIAVHSELIEKVYIKSGGKDYYFRPFRSEEVGLSDNNGGNIYTRFYEVIYESEIYGYYKLSIKVFNKEDSITPDKAYDVNETEGTYSYRQKYFLKTPSGEFVVTPPRKKGFLSALPNQANLLKGYIKSEKPVFNQAEDLRKMFSFLEKNLKD